ncbi:MAG: transcriptional repressor, CopY family [Solirubrobacterales bacterium]|jgi:predicted transcriptional regulator|nr:transcriptional repressor, CopY family [Solirubrobacterales bacterium]
MTMTPPQLHSLEREVMEELWDRDTATVREILEALNARSEKSRAYTTVMTIMRRLDDKGMLVREREQRTDIYRTTLSRDDYAQARARAQIGALVDEFGDVALLHFARQVDALDPERRAALERLAHKQ